MNYQAFFSHIHTELQSVHDPGKVATYIPELGNVDPNKFGVHLTTVKDEHHCLGDSDEKFSIQSIAKVLALTLAYEHRGEQLWKRVGVEPSGTAFNSLVQLESDHGIPRNPLINAGALVVSDVLVGLLDDPKKDFLQFVRTVAHNPNIQYNERIAESEKATGFRNAAHINLMKAYANIQHEIETVLDFYFYLCSIEMSCRELARTFLFLAHHGSDPCSGLRITSVSKSKRINTIMQLCGFYDEAGEFSFKVGIPGKSGVGGGIAAVHPGHYSIAVWSPRLNPKGNSFMGVEFLERLTTLTEESIFCKKSETEVGLGFTHSLGGATLAGGISRNFQKNIQADVGIRFTF
ncbi:MAG: glutaminase [Bacteroidota bacterium]